MPLTPGSGVPPEVSASSPRQMGGTGERRRRRDAQAPATTQ
jgi:hypothetical protein